MQSSAKRKSFFEVHIISVLFSISCQYILDEILPLSKGIMRCLVELSSQTFGINAGESICLEHQ